MTLKAFDVLVGHDLEGIRRDGGKKFGALFTIRSRRRARGLHQASKLRRIGAVLILLQLGCVPFDRAGASVM